MKKLSVSILVAALALGACGGPDAPPATDGPGAPATAAPGQTDAQTDPVELTLQVDVSDQLRVEMWQRLVSSFEASHPNIRVTLLAEPGDREERARRLLATGNFPDVIWALPHAPYKDELLALDTSDPEIADQMMNLDRLLIDGNLYGLGIDLQIWNGIFYNKDLFEAAGITNTPTTWDEFDRVLEQLKAAGITPLLGSGEWKPHFTFQALSDIYAETECWLGLRERGERTYSDEEWVNDARRFARWVDSGYFNEGPLGLGFTQGNDLFLQGTVAMYATGSTRVGLFDQQPPNFEVGYFPTPTRSGELKLTGSIGTLGYVVSRTSDHPDEAVQLAKWLTFDEEPLTEVLNALGLHSNIELTSGPLDGLIQSDLHREVGEVMRNAVSHNTAWNGQGECSQRPGAQLAFGELVVEPLYLDPTQPVEPLLQAMDEFWENARVDE